MSRTSLRKALSIFMSKFMSKFFTSMVERMSNYLPGGHRHEKKVYAKRIRLRQLRG